MKSCCETHPAALRQPQHVISFCAARLGMVSYDFGYRFVTRFLQNSQKTSEFFPIHLNGKAPTQVTVGPYRLAVLHLNFIRVTRLWTEIHSGSGGLMIFSSTSSSELHRRPAPEDGEAQHFMNSHGHPHKSSSHRQTGLWRKRIRGDG